MAAALKRVVKLPTGAGKPTHQLKPLPGFDWSKVTWGRPDSPPSVLCSYCSAVIPEDDVPLMMWNRESYCARFCERCMETWWGMT
jgi:hypothetical protein